MVFLSQPNPSTPKFHQHSKPINHSQPPPFPHQNNQSIPKSPSYQEALTEKQIYGINNKEDRKKTEFSTIFIGRLASLVTPHVLSNAFRRFGWIQGISRKRDRNFAFLKFEKKESALEAIRIMNGRNLLHKRIFVGMANKDMFVANGSNQSKFGQNIGKPGDKKEACSPIDLEINEIAQIGLELSVLLIDREMFSIDKLKRWLKNRHAKINRCSLWGSYGCVIRCKDLESFNNVTNGPDLNDDGYLSIQPMNQRSDKYSKAVWLEIKGIPFLSCSLESTRAIAKNFGEVLYVEKCTYELGNVGSLFALVESEEPGLIQGFKTVKTKGGNIMRVYVQEVVDDVNLAQVFKNVIPKDEVQSWDLDMSNEAQFNGNDIQIIVPSPSCMNSIMEEDGVNHSKSTKSGNVHAVEVLEKMDMGKVDDLVITNFKLGEEAGKCDLGKQLIPTPNVYNDVFVKMKEALAKEVQKGGWGSGSSNQNVPSKVSPIPKASPLSSKKSQLILPKKLNFNSNSEVSATDSDIKICCNEECSPSCADYRINVQNLKEKKANEKIVKPSLAKSHKKQKRVKDSVLNDEVFVAKLQHELVDEISSDDEVLPSDDIVLEEVEGNLLNPTCVNLKAAVFGDYIKAFRYSGVSKNSAPQ